MKEQKPQSGSANAPYVEVPAQKGKTAAPPAPPPKPQVKCAVIFCHPSHSEGHGVKILGRVKQTLETSGAEFEIIDLYAEKFNPLMDEAEFKSYESGAQKKDDVARCQKIISSSGLLVFIYPSWWSTPPAMLKGFIDRVFTPGFAYNSENGEMRGLLSSMRALCIRTYAGGAEAEEANGHVSSNFMEKAVLGSCGIKSSSVDIYSTHDLDKTTFNHYLFQIEGAVRRMLVKPTEVPHHLRWIAAPYLPPIEQQEKKPPARADGARGAYAAFQSGDAEYRGGAPPIFGGDEKKGSSFPGQKGGAQQFGSGRKGAPNPNWKKQQSPRQMRVNYESERARRWAEEQRRRTDGRNAPAVMREGARQQAGILREDAPAQPGARPPVFGSQNKPNQNRQGGNPNWNFGKKKKNRGFFGKRK